MTISEYQAKLGDLPEEDKFVEPSVEAKKRENNVLGNLLPIPMPSGHPFWSISASPLGAHGREAG